MITKEHTVGVQGTLFMHTITGGLLIEFEAPIVVYENFLIDVSGRKTCADIHEVRYVIGEFRSLTELTGLEY
jgi:hypothetical protein